MVLTNGALTTIPLGVRFAAALCGFLAFLAIKRSVFVGVAVGETVLNYSSPVFVVHSEPVAEGHHSVDFVTANGKHVKIAVNLRRF